MSDVADKQLLDLPPSAKLVFWVLEEKGPLTKKQIAEETLLSSRTVRYALNQLDEIDVIDEQTHSMDNRMKIYRVSKTS